MTYLRRVLFESGSISCQLATLEAAEPGWSPPYRVQGPRLLLPLSQRFECRLGADAFVCDPAAALWLSNGLARCAAARRAMAGTDAGRGRGLLGLWIFGAAVARLGASQAAAFGGLAPVFSAIGGWWWLAEPVTGAGQIAIASAVIGVALASGAWSRRARTGGAA